MLKNSLFFFNFKNSPSSGGSASRSRLAFGGWKFFPLTPCDLTHTYCTATRRSKFVTLFNESFKGKILVKTFFKEHTIHLEYFVLNIRADSPHPQTVLFSYGYDSVTSPSNFFVCFVKFGQVWLNLCEVKV